MPAVGLSDQHQAMAVEYIRWGSTMLGSSSSRPEVWGGLECTVARVGDSFRDQCAETGHLDRPDDLDAIAGLGLRTVRYPILWETISPDAPNETDWEWHDRRLHRLRQLGIEVIATLCHHGSGPRYTSLLDPEFPKLLAAHAERVARRYPWIGLYTPVNEPLTTARFSALYGHWYPHRADSQAFVRALLTECSATVLAMKAIRRARPDALLVQTEDLGKTFSRPRLAYQAEHENERRWLTFDLLCGRVDRHHPLWDFLIASDETAEPILSGFLSCEAPPDLIGVNHYLTSDRYLDERFTSYPDHHHGGNGRERYADVEAIRMNLPELEIGPLARLSEAWTRYRRPIAVTEVHHGCTRDEQLRWLMEVWRAACALRAAGADVRAVTVWALLGTVDWNSLLTRSDQVYEPGVFDVRGRKPRPTALAKAASSLATQGVYDHPVLDGPGWWRRNDRFYQAVTKSKTRGDLGRAKRPVLITGATGTLGRAFARICQHRGLEHVLTSREELDLADRSSIDAALKRHRPWAIVNAAGYVRVAAADHDHARCVRDNVTAAENLAQSCQAAGGLPLVSFSSDRVFDGTLGRAYVECDRPAPNCLYGSSKAMAEQAVLAAHPRALMIRTSTFFGPWDRYNFAYQLLEALSADRSFAAPRDVISATYVPDLVHVALDLLIDGEQGLWHLTSPVCVSWLGLARLLARGAGFDPSLVVETPSEGTLLNRGLSSQWGVLLPPLESAIERFLNDCEIPSKRSLAIAAE
jgi:dTDP-4-dehydrorhamnose reductase